MKISIIIPALNEALCIGRTIQSLAGQAFSQAVSIEILLVDGGSTDQTASIAAQVAEEQALDLRVHRTERGRARQQNEGAAHAAGDLLLFLHADTQLSPNAIAALAGLCSPSPGAVQAASVLPDEERRCFGYFYTTFDSAHPLARLYSAATQVNSIFFHYGDCGIFVRRDFFIELGGFRPLELMEDVDFLLRASKQSAPLLITEACLITSARRFERTGFLFGQLLNAGLVGLFLLGADTKILKKIYDLV